MLAPALSPDAGDERAARRALLFREAPLATLRRWILGTFYTCHPRRIGDLPYLFWWAGRDLARGGTSIPDPASTHPRPDTFGGVCRDISPETILAAARLGFYPMSHFGPLKWWTKAQRMVLFFPEQHIAKRFRPILRNTPWRVTFDTAFDEVVKACAEPRSNRAHTLTWVTPQIMRLYAELHDQGHAHSVEVWSEDGRLIGGCYGLAVGRIFVTESLFFRESNASKIAYHVLNHHLAKWGYVLNDTKVWSGAMQAMGFRFIPRAEFERVLAEHAHTGGRSAPWTIEADPATIAA
jgi:leucyl/phenylalanyl-tRNA--protein transferase